MALVVYFGYMGRDPFREQIAVNTANIADLRREQERQRDKIHHIESMAHGVRALTKVVDELQESMPNLARRAAKEAVAEAQSARHRDVFANLRTYALLVSTGVGLGALIVGLVVR